MNFSFNIELVELGEKCHIYTVRIDDDEYTEFENFLIDDYIYDHLEFQSLMARIKYIAHEVGAQDQFFKLGEGALNDAIAALWRDNLRLYCCRYGNILILLGGGGIKKTRTYQEDEHLNHCVEVLQYVSNRIDQRINDGEITYDNKYKFQGNLKFEREDI